MKRLRTVTFLATWLLMFVTMVIPPGFVFVKEGPRWVSSPMMLINLALSSAILGVVYSSPLLVSGIILLFSKRPHRISLILLLLATVGYGIVAFYALYDVSVHGGSCMDEILFFGFGMTSFIFLIPVWIIVLVLNAYHVKGANVSPETVMETTET